MIRNLLIAASALALAAPPAPGQVAATKSAEARARPKPKPQGPPDFKVVFWFDGKTFRHQAYDVRKGQYTQAVDDWVNRVEFSPSGYVLAGTMATVREVRLKDEPGDTEAEKLDAAILRARKAMADFDASRIRAPALSSGRGDLTRAPGAGSSYARSYRGPAPGGPSSLGDPIGAAGAPLTVPAPASPFPYPYARPHP